MKTFRIFPLALIIVGLVALAGILHEGVPAVPVQSPIALKDGQQCYTYSHAATATEPYDVNEFVNITIHGTVVTGTKTGTQNGPDMTNGYSGIMQGTMSANSITDVFSYIIEGSANKEKELYTAGLTGIEKHRYPLIESNGMLVPDTAKAFAVMNYARVPCKGSN